MNEIIPIERVENKILFMREQKVMLSIDLASLYQVQHKVFMQAVRRNMGRFPDDFMFQLNRQEWLNLKSQFVTSRWGGLRKLPYAFTEQGVAMLSSVLHSKQAVQVNIVIIRAFVKLRQILSTHKDLAHKLEELEQKFETHDKQIISIFEAIRQLMLPPEKPKRQMGFVVKEPKNKYRAK